jgi:CheY-like chemotaxis protein
MACEFDTHFKIFHELMSNKVLEILLVASAYDAYILEEDGSLAAKIIHEYHGLNLSRPPRLTRVDNARQALAMLKANDYDLVLAMPHLDDMDSFELGRAIKTTHPNLPVILLAHSMEGLHPLPPEKDASGIDGIFIWSGDADLLLAIVKSVEDRLNVDMDSRHAQVRVIILVEDSPLYRSYLLPLMYKEVVHQTQEVLEESLNESHRLMKMRARPKILVAETYEQALDLFERHAPYLFGVVSDTRYPRKGRVSADAGYRFLQHVRSQIPDLPMLLISSEPENRDKAKHIPAIFLDKNSPSLFDELHTFFLDHLGFGAFVFRNASGRELARANNLRQLETVLSGLPDEPLIYHASRNRFSNWIMARSEIALATRLRESKISDFSDVDALRRFLIDSIHSLRQWRQKGVVAQFNAKNYDPSVVDFVKIGQGSLGGKARGLAFAASLLRQSSHVFERFKSIDIHIPRTLVITTSVFDAFVETNHLDDLPLDEMSDTQIGKAFTNAQMPAGVVEDLKSYLNVVRYPLSVRSSSLLEDAHHQPLSGLYETIMISNHQADDSQRLRRLIQSIKRVYASTWYAMPRRFTRSAAFRHRKERMAVIVQQAAGQSQGGYFYPAISGLARSQNYYPVGPIRPGHGTATIVLGFGRAIARGEAGLRFCPVFPTVLPDFSKVEDILANAQQHFYALSLQEGGDNVQGTGTDLVRRYINDAINEVSVRKLVSTYVSQDGRIRDSVLPEGPKLVTFASVLKHDFIPLPDLISELLAMGREGMGCHVEFEFAVNWDGLDGKAPRMDILQMRPMASSGPFDVMITDQDREAAICFATQALGHGRNLHMTDIVYVRPEPFDVARTKEIAHQISRINSGLKAEGRSYLLIGPGRWGSFDPWLGIPVKWEDINAAGAIIELRNHAIKAEPSHGSHFFQHITTNGLYYLTLTEEGTDGSRLRWDTIASQTTVAQTPFVRHVRCSDPLLIKCDGRTSQCVILPATGPVPS